MTCCLNALEWNDRRAASRSPSGEQLVGVRRSVELLDRDEAFGARGQELKDEHLGAPGSLDGVNMALVVRGKSHPTCTRPYCRHCR